MYERATQIQQPFSHVLRPCQALAKKQDGEIAFRNAILRIGEAFHVKSPIGMACNGRREQPGLAHASKTEIFCFPLEHDDFSSNDALEHNWQSK